MMIFKFPGSNPSEALIHVQAVLAAASIEAPVFASLNGDSVEVTVELEEVV